MVWLEAGPEPTIKGGARGAPRSCAGRRAPGGGAASDSRARASSGGFRTDSPRPARRRRRPSLAAGRGRRAVPGALGARAAPPPRRRDERGERPPGPVAPGPAARGDAGVAGPRGRGEGAGQRPEGEASSGRCGWRLAGAAAPGEESPPRDAVGVRRGPGLPGSAHCIQRGVRPASPGGGHPPLPHPPAPRQQTGAEGLPCGGAWAPAGMSPRSRPPSAVLVAPGSFVGFRGVASSQCRPVCTDAGTGGGRGPLGTTPPASGCARGHGPRPGLPSRPNWAWAAAPRACALRPVRGTWGLASQPQLGCGPGSSPGLAPWPRRSARSTWPERAPRLLAAVFSISSSILESYFSVTLF